MNFSASAQGKRVPRPVEIFHLFVIPSTALRSHVYCSAGLWYKCIPVSLSELDQFGRYYPTKSISGKIDSGCIRSEQMLCCSECSFILYATSVLLSKSPISRLALWLNSPVRAIICNILKKKKKKINLVKCMLPDTRMCFASAERFFQATHWSTCLCNVICNLST